MSEREAYAPKEPGYTPIDISLLNEEHIRRYRETNGEVGAVWNGAPALLLTANGRKSGEPRTIAIIYGTDGEDFLLVASYGGQPKHPQWYHNLLANPEAEIQVRDKVIPVRARQASEEEKPRLWKIMADIWPNYNVYQTRTERVIPIMVLTPR
jgi:deazaflavin-dependent oxidoreductase (nitroreductase family)